MVQVADTRQSHPDGLVPTTEDFDFLCGFGVWGAQILV